MLMMSIMAGLVSLLAAMLAGTATIEQNQKSVLQSEFRSKALDLTSHVTAILKNQQTWEELVVANPSMDCVENSTDCNNPATGAAPIYQEYRNITLIPFLNGTSAGTNFLFNGNSQNNGIQEGTNLNGETWEPCSTYSNPSEDNPCRYRVDAKWRPLCPIGGPCINSYIEVQIAVLLNGSHQQSINYERRSRIVVLSPP